MAVMIDLPSFAKIAAVLVPYGNACFPEDKETASVWPVGRSLPRRFFCLAAGKGDPFAST